MTKRLLVFFYCVYMTFESSTSFAIQSDLTDVASEKLENLEKSLLISSRGFLYSIKELLEDFEDDQDDFLDDFLTNLPHSMKEPLARLQELKESAKNSLENTERCFLDEDLLTSKLFNETSERVTICFEDGVEAVAQSILRVIDDCGINKTLEVIEDLQSDLDKCEESDEDCIGDVIENIDEWKSNYPLKYIEAMYEVTVYESGGVILFQACLEAEKEELERKAFEVLNKMRLCVKNIVKK